jgi:glycosyltransferase involved in cell wall biosynthesis
MDENLDFDRYEMMFMGGYPKWFTPRRLQIVTANGSSAVADFLRSGDIYFAPSRFEPASNAVSEALACGLPVLYQEGSSHGDLVGEAGLGFKYAGPALLKSLNEMVENYSKHFEAIYVPGMEETSIRKSYLIC